MLITYRNQNARICKLALMSRIGNLLTVSIAGASSKLLSGKQEYETVGPDSPVRMYTRRSLFENDDCAQVRFQSCFSAS